MNNAVAGVMKTTFDLKSYELQPIAARFEILNPSTNYKAVKLPNGSFSLFQAQIPTTTNKLLIAFSGGLDSTALLSFS